MTDGSSPTLLPTTRITATYPATDGSAPESIEVIWEIEHPTPEQIAKIIAALAAVTRREAYVA